MSKLSKKEFKKIEKIVENAKKDRLIQKQKLESIITDTNYIDWLEQFSLKYNKFFDDGFIYTDEIITGQDNDNIKKLEYLFKNIDNYATNNHIYPKKHHYEIFYKIKYNNIGYEIGIFTGQGSSFYCKRVEVEPDFIDFNYILNNKEQENVEKINKRLKEFSDSIILMQQEGIPQESIKNTFENTLKLTKR